MTKMLPTVKFMAMVFSFSLGLSKLGADIIFVKTSLNPCVLSVIRLEVTFYFADTKSKKDIIHIHCRE
jgi:hypothetical protein